MSSGPKRESPVTAGIGFILVGLVVVFTVLGYFADRWLHTKPWLMVAGVFVGAGLGFVYLVLIWLADSSGDHDRKERKNRSEDERPDEGSL